MTTTHISDRAGKTLKVVKMKDRIYSPFPVENLMNVLDFKARPDDVLLCAYPKSGTHWTYQIIRYLLAGEVDDTVVEKIDGMIDSMSASQCEDVASPRNINTHFHYDSLSKDFWRQKSKIIYVTRDPRDIAVSYYNHLTQLPFHEYDGEWKDFFQLYLEGTLDYNSWFDYTKGWEQAVKENPDHPILILTYEGMKKDPLEHVRKIAEFLDVRNQSDEFFQNIVEKTSFSAMRGRREETSFKYIYLYRKGKVGDWKDWFTVAQLEAFNQAFEREMVGTHAYTLYSHSLQQ